jgi:UDP-N-acetylmuramoyl-tripeptide--D-alanyl-D-alanine ligase
VGDLAQIIAEEASVHGMPVECIVPCQDRCEAEDFLRDEINEGDVVLIKGSRGLQLDKLVMALEVSE